MITFYDLPSTLACNAWSPNTWKTRLSLNYKGLPYKTEWIEFPDVAELCKEKGIGPTPSPWIEGRGTPYYSLPAILDSSDPTKPPTALAESLEIAKYLDQAYPETKKLIPEGSEALQRNFASRFGALVYPPIAPIYFPLIANILNPASAPYFSRQRGYQVFDKTSLEEVTYERGEEARMWESFRGAWNTLWEEFYANNEGKLWLMGDEITFADLVVVGYLISFVAMFGEDSWQWLELRTLNGGKWGEMYDAMAHLRDVL